MEHHNLTTRLEAVLLFKNEPVAKAELCAILSVDETALQEALALLDSSYTRGIRLSQTNDSVSLVTAPEASEIIEQLTKDELQKDIGKAGLEVLAIVLYKGPISRREIDFIRGVNSQSIIRNLLIRGLISKSESKKEGERSTVYEATHELLSFMGVVNCAQLPEYDTVTTELDSQSNSSEITLDDPNNESVS